MNAELMTNGMLDLRDALAFGLERLRPNDDFDAGACLSWIDAEISSLPESTDAIQKLLAHASEVRERRQAELDPWDALDLDWRKFHPDARKLLDDPFIWFNDDDFAPHGNDTGSDLFSEFSRYKNLNPLQAMRRMFGEEYVSDDLSPAREDEWWQFVQTCLALAFGHIKKYGTCPADLLNKTRQALAEDLRETDTHRSGWEYADEWRKRIRQYDKILSELP